PRLTRVLALLETVQPDVVELVGDRILEALRRLFLDSEENCRSIPRPGLPHEAVGPRLDLGKDSRANRRASGKPFQVTPPDRGHVRRLHACDGALPDVQLRERIR